MVHAQHGVDPRVQGVGALRLSQFTAYFTIVLFSSDKSATNLIILLIVVRQSIEAHIGLL
jgi:hypothetical protein